MPNTWVSALTKFSFSGFCLIRRRFAWSARNLLSKLFTQVLSGTAQVLVWWSVFFFCLFLKAKEEIKETMKKYKRKKKRNGWKGTVRLYHCRKPSHLPACGALSGRWRTWSSCWTSSTAAPGTWSVASVASTRTAAASPASPSALASRWGPTWTPPASETRNRHPRVSCVLLFMNYLSDTSSGFLRVGWSWTICRTHPRVSCVLLIMNYLSDTPSGFLSVADHELSVGHTLGFPACWLIMNYLSDTPSGFLRVGWSWTICRTHPRVSCVLADHELSVGQCWSPFFVFGKSLRCCCFIINS